MTKYCTGLFIPLILFTCIAVSQTSQGRANDFTKMTFDAALEKTTFKELEPIDVRFKFSNKTDGPLTTLTPDFLSYAEIKVTGNGRNEVIEISMVRPNTRRFPRTFQSGDSIEEKMILNTNLDLLFPYPGSYKVQFVLGDGKGTKAIESKPIEIVVDEPTGIDREAFDFINRYQKLSNYPQVLFSWSDQTDEKGKNLLVAFVEKYSQTVYGEFATQSLGNLYLVNGELEKAKAEFEKLKDSEHKTIVEDAKRNLLAIEKRKAELERAKPPK